MIDTTAARLQALAKEGARVLHCNSHSDDGHKWTPLTDKNYGFATCPHPDCALVRSLEAETPPAKRADAHNPPAVHHWCQPSNLPDAPPMGSWCHHSKTWRDGAAQQDDYECSRCKTKISTNISQWREPDVAAVPPPSGEQDAQETQTKAASQERTEPSDEASSVVHAMPEVDTTRGVVAVAGRFDRTLVSFERSCLVLLDDEQRKISPDNAIIATLCDAVRLSRQHADLEARAFLEPPPSGATTEEIRPARGERQAPRLGLAVS